jgi:hypothetical protein
MNGFRKRPSLNPVFYFWQSRAIVNEPGVVFDDIMKTDEIIKRAESVSEKYDELIKYTQAYLLHGVSENDQVSIQFSTSGRETIGKKAILGLLPWTESSKI